MAQKEPKAMDLLSQYEQILESDPLIDEIGYIHPSQFTSLNEEAGSSSSTSEILENNDANFWLKDHKLGISTEVLHPLYTLVRNAFLEALGKYMRFCNRDNQADVENSSSSINVIEGEVLKHSKALLLLSCDFATAWNSRKFIMSQKQHVSMHIDELLLSKLVLSYFSKSEQAWSHRRWVIKLIIQKGHSLQEILKKESELVERIAEMSKMNYRAWNHRRWLVSFMSKEQALNELKETRKWAALHVADNCCFHYRRRLMLKISEDSTCRKANSDLSIDIYQLWKDELDWDEMLIKRYIGREALWIHRRFLSSCWINHFATGLSTTVPCKYEEEREIKNDIVIFLENELNLANSCSLIPDNDFEDFQAQATYSATYILWLIKNCPISHGIELNEKIKASNLKSLVYKACPQRSSLWDSLLLKMENSD